VVVHIDRSTNRHPLSGVALLRRSYVLQAPETRAESSIKNRAAVQLHPRIIAVSLGLAEKQFPDRPW
jgi:hypothetical protein